MTSGTWTSVNQDLLSIIHFETNVVILDTENERINDKEVFHSLSMPFQTEMLQFVSIINQWLHTVFKIISQYHITICPLAFKTILWCFVLSQVPSQPSSPSNLPKHTFLFKKKIFPVIFTLSPSPPPFFFIKIKIYSTKSSHIIICNSLLPSFFSRGWMMIGWIHPPIFWFKQHIILECIRKMVPLEHFGVPSVIHLRTFRFCNVSFRLITTTTGIKYRVVEGRQVFLWGVLGRCLRVPWHSGLGADAVRVCVRIGVVREQGHFGCLLLVFTQQTARVAWEMGEKGNNLQNSNSNKSWWCHKHINKTRVTMRQRFVTTKYW